VFVAFLLLRVFKDSALVFLDVPPFTLVDIYQHFGGNLLLPSSGYKKMEAGSSETYSRLHGVASHKDVFFIVKDERDLYFATVLIRVAHFFLINQSDALIIQIYSVIKLYMFRASSLPIIRNFPLYIRHW
jgi:hypothetical protein